MFDRLKNSWELVKASAAVLRADKELLIFPIISGIGSIIVLLTFIVPTFLAGLFDEIAGFPILGYIIGFMFYFTTYLVVIFCNSALVGAAMIRLRGGDPTVMDGFRIATKNITSILGYAAIAATVGLILRNLNERAGSIGRIIISLLEFGWTVATFLVVPVLVVEGVGPIDAIKRSVNLLKQTWGEQLVGNFGIGTVFGLLYFVVIIAAIPIMLGVTALGNVPLIVLAAVMIAFVFIALGLVSSALSGIYAAAVYQFATQEATDGGFFDPELVKNAFRTKGSKKLW